MSYTVLPLAAFALILAFEGVSVAKTQESPLAAQRATETSTSADPADVAAHEDGLVKTAAHARVCHISRHPRDGMPASEHACPLFVADTSTPSAGAARAN